MKTEEKYWPYGRKILMGSCGEISKLWVKYQFDERVMYVE